MATGITGDGIKCIKLFHNPTISKRNPCFGSDDPSHCGKRGFTGTHIATRQGMDTGKGLIGAGNQQHG